MRFYFDVVRNDILYADSHGDEFEGAAQAVARAEEIRDELLGDAGWGGYAIEIHDASENLISFIPLSERSGDSAPIDPSRPYVLSPRERIILRGLSKGSSIEEIARKLSLSVRIVDICRARMFDRIEVGKLAANIRDAREEN